MAHQIIFILKCVYCDYGDVTKRFANITMYQWFGSASNALEFEPFKSLFTYEKMVKVVEMLHQLYAK